MKRIFLLFFIIALCVGIGAALIHYEWILWQGSSPSYEKKSNASVVYRTVDIWYKQYHEWKKETISLIGKNKLHLLNGAIEHWLLIAQEGGIMKKRGHKETILLDIKELCVYLSFEQPLFERQSSTLEKIELIMGICKTIDMLELGIQYCFFLVNHTFMYDDHLDFSAPWSVKTHYRF